MPSLPVKGLPSADSGRLIVRLNHKHRSGVERYGIARITNETSWKSVNVLLLGHDDAGAIFMPYDIRTALKVDKSEELNFSITKLGRFGKLCWYLNSIDPAVHVPAWIAVFGLILAFIGLFIGLLPLICS